MSEREILIEQHSPLRELVFHIKVTLLIMLRAFKNALLNTPRKFSINSQLQDAAIISYSHTDLWSTADDEQNWILTAGKVQNLRVAAKKLHGLEIPANEIFSFWKHIGNPNRKSGFVIGREIREGCIIPTIAGGLCQLSNALYDAALKAGFEIVERHKHTQVIKGSLAEIDRDATVKWNYLDLRFKSSYDFRIEIEITADKLLVAFKVNVKNNAVTTTQQIKTFTPPSIVNDCYSCGNWECFKHPNKPHKHTHKAITTYILDERWEEYEVYIKNASKADDYFIVPFLPNKFLKLHRHIWSVTNNKKVSAVWLNALYRLLLIKVHAKLKRNIFSTLLEVDKKIAVEMAKDIPVESTHIVISQNLLPFLWAEGALGGRTFDVFMSRLPIQKLHERLDAAYQKYPESQTLSDFRASEELILLENTALTKARHIITPHREIAELFNNKSIKLQWHYPNVSVDSLSRGNKILFPASALGRKGAYELRRLAKELNLSIRITGRATEDQDFWKGINIEKAKTNLFEDIQLVVYPTYVEHQPRFLLKAIKFGIPIITTTASGLDETENVTIVPIGDYDALKRSVEACLKR